MILGVLKSIREHALNAEEKVFWKLKDLPQERTGKPSRPAILNAISVKLHWN